MKRRVRRKAPWERSTRRLTPEEDAHENRMEILALIADNLDDMFRSLTPVEQAIYRARREILAERRRRADPRRERPVPWLFPLAGWVGMPRPWLPPGRRWSGLRIVLAYQFVVLEPRLREKERQRLNSELGWPNELAIDLESFGQDR